MHDKKRHRKKQLVKSKVGKPPGTLLYVGDKEIKSAKISFLEYDENTYNLKQINTLDELAEVKNNSNPDTNKWINVNGISDVEEMSKIAEYFNIHPLIMEDIMNIYQRTKVEINDDNLFTVLRGVEISDAEGVKHDHVCLFLQNKFIITFQDREENIFSNFFERMDNGKKLIRKAGIDYLYYALIDQLVDQYFVVIEEISEKIDNLFEELMKDPTSELLQKIHELKKANQDVRQNSKSLREILNSLIRDGEDFIKSTTEIYFRDTLDHTIQITEALETLRESIGTLMDVYLSSVSNKMNQVMKVLTIIATIFIPLTFIAGVYGMNFQNMPELNWRYGYLAVWGIMLMTVIFLGYFFKKKKWL